MNADPIEARVQAVRARIRQVTAVWEVARFNLELVLPLLHDKDIANGLDKTHAAHAFNMLTQTLVFDVIKDAYKFALDRTQRYDVATIPNVILQIEDEELVRSLRDEFSRVDPTVPAELLALFGPQEGQQHADDYVAKRRRENEERFDQLLNTTRATYTDFAESELADRIRTARNKVIAHSEMVARDDQVAPFDLASIKLKYGDPQKFFECIEPVVAGLENIARSTDINVEGTRDVFKEYAEKFWSITKLGLKHANKRDL